MFPADCQSLTVDVELKQDITAGGSLPAAHVTHVQSFSSSSSFSSLSSAGLYGHSGGTFRTCTPPASNEPPHPPPSPLQVSRALILDRALVLADPAGWRRSWCRSMTARRWPTCWRTAASSRRGGTTQHASRAHSQITQHMSRCHSRNTEHGSRCRSRITQTPPFDSGPCLADFRLMEMPRQLDTMKPNLSKMLSIGKDALRGGEDGRDNQTF